MSDEHDDDLGQVFKDLADRFDDDGGRERVKKKLPSISESVRSLVEGYALYHEHYAFKPGMLIRGKARLADHMVNGAERPHIILRLLDKPFMIAPTTRSAGSPWASMEYNAVIAAYMPPTEGGTPEIVPYLSDLHFWEPYPESEYKDKIA